MSEAPELWREKPQIIVVDDNPANLRLMMDILSYEGYEVRPANSGKLALASATALPPDLIILDVMLPDQSGYDVCRELKSRQDFKDIPIIFASGLDEGAVKTDAFASGGADIMTKPIHHKELLAKVRTHLEARRLRMLLAQSRQETEAREERIRALEAENQELKGTVEMLCRQ